MLNSSSTFSSIYVDPSEAKDVKDLEFLPMLSHAMARFPPGTPTTPPNAFMPREPMQPTLNQSAKRCESSESFIDHLRTILRPQKKTSQRSAADRKIVIEMHRPQKFAQPKQALIKIDISHLVNQAVAKDLVALFDVRTLSMECGRLGNFHVQAQMTLTGPKILSATYAPPIPPKSKNSAPVTSSNASASIPGAVRN